MRLKYAVRDIIIYNNYIIILILLYKTLMRLKRAVRDIIIYNKVMYPP
jgi:hypothetical protein